jgi:signal transduction histidine kinase
MKKILIIEDNKPLREEVCDWFSFEGFETCQAANGKEGVEMAFRDPPQLILCDIMMPEMDGNQVLEHLRGNPTTRFIPFLFMTALSEREQIRAGMNLGADDYITKPFTRVELLNAVRARLHKSDEVREYAESALQELRHNLTMNLPHELRTPLNGILGFAQMLRDNADSFEKEELPEIGERIFNSSMRLYRLIQNYLLYAQLEIRSADEMAQYEIVNPGKICETQALQIAEKYKREEDLEITLDQGVVFMSEIEFGKIIEELTDNAFKFSVPKSKVMIFCGMRNGSFLVEVKDHGRGIPAEHLSKIGAYMQFDRKINEQQGSGLGLIISKRIAELFHGEMKIESTPGTGTTVTIILPGH